MSPGSIGTASIDIGPAEQHTKKRISDLPGVRSFLWCTIEGFFLSLKTGVGRKAASLD